MINLNFQFTGWDYVMLVTVSLVGTAIAYVHHPKWKALLMSLPIPFTVAMLALGNAVQVNATHALGMVLVLSYVHGVRLLYVRAGMPIFGAIMLMAGSYVVVALLVVRHIPTVPWAFWTLEAAAFLLSAAILRFTKHRQEPGHRTPMPVWIKLPVTAVVILMLIVGKKMLQGFMAMFPMLVLLASYEARHSLWTVCRSFSRFTLWTVPMLAVVHVAQPHTGLGPALALGWVVYLALFLPFTLREWRLHGGPVEEEPPPCHSSHPPITMRGA